MFWLFRSPGCNTSFELPFIAWLAFRLYFMAGIVLHFVSIACVAFELFHSVRRFQLFCWRVSRSRCLFSPCIRKPARPGQTGVKVGPESRGEPSLWPSFGHVGQGIKKPGQPSLAWPRLAGAKIEKENGQKNINGLHGLYRPRLAGVKTGKAWQGKGRGLQLACTGRSWWDQKLVKLAKKRLAKIKLYDMPI